VAGLILAGSLLILIAVGAEMLDVQALMAVKSAILPLSGCGSVARRPEAIREFD
jgi:hypothetical protein